MLGTIKHEHKWKWDLLSDTFSLSGELLSLLEFTDNEFAQTYESYINRLHSNDQSEVNGVIQTAITNKSSYYIEYRVITLKGKEITLQDSGTTVLDHQGNAIAIEGKVKDITANRRASKALWKSEYKLAVAHKIAGLVSWEYDPNTRLIDWSDGIYDLLGAEPLTVDSYFNFVHPQDLDFLKKTGRLSNKGYPYNIEYRLIKPDGTQIVVYEQAEVFFDRNGKIERKLGTLQDITERKKTEERLLNSEKLSVVGQMAAGVAHEIRNPLTSLRGFIQLLDGGISSPEYFRIMLDELDRIEFIVSEFLNLAKPQATSYDYQYPGKILTDVISLIKTEANLNNIKIDCSNLNEIPEIYCEKNQIKQVFINLIKNAIDAMPNGGTILVDATVMPCNHVLIKIKDQGIGIEKERLKKIGEPFYSTKEKGTGLGIMICHKIIESHGGEISFKSSKNKGTTVSVTLPLNRNAQVSG